MASEQDENDGSPRQNLLRLLSHMTPSRRRQLVVVMLLMLLGALAEMFTLGAVLPLLSILSDPNNGLGHAWLGPIFESLGYERTDSVVIPAAVLFMAIAAVACVIRLTLSWTSTRFVYNLGHDLGVKVFRHVITQPYAYYTATNTSQQIAALNKIDTVVNGLLFQSMVLVSSLVLAIFIIAALVLIDPVVALSSAAAISLLYFCVMLLTRPRIRANSKTFAAAQGQRVQTLQESIGGIRDVIIDRSHNLLIGRYEDIDRSLRTAQASNSFLAASPRVVIEAIGMIFIAGLAVALSFRSGGLSAALPVLGALALGAQRLLPMLQQAYSAWTYIGANNNVVKDVLDILDLPIDRRIAGDVAAEPLPFTDRITLESVSFRYSHDRPWVLDGISLDIVKGSRVAFVGKTGSGKSTIVDLVMGLLAPSAGTISIDDRPLDADTVAGWQARIAHVPQSIYLADSSIAENIAFGLPASKIDWDRLRSAAERAEIADFITTLPSGYETFVGERGIRLSGGQRQRIGIARALYKDADVLILDEATSALDNDTEAAVMQSIEKLNRNLTIIIIAHRLSTVALCDVVFEISSGRLVAGSTQPAVQSMATS